MEWLDGAKVDGYIRCPLLGRGRSQPKSLSLQTFCDHYSGSRNYMKKKLCLLAALCLSVASFSCQKIAARMAIRDANTAYEKEDYKTALSGYEKARTIDSSFADLDRMVGYSEIGLYIPDEKSPTNEAHADAAIPELNKHLKKRPNDPGAPDAPVNRNPNPNRPNQAIASF